MDIVAEFARVISCIACTSHTSTKLLRDSHLNLPQPGFIGQRYAQTGLVLAGQNPGLSPPRFALQDAEYMRALRKLQDKPTPQVMSELTKVLHAFVPKWPIHGNCFPLKECGLELDDIAYFNVVRCRTEENSAPGKGVIVNCLDHFERWVDLVHPKVLIFLGKWAFKAAGHIPAQRGIRYAFINRDRSLNKKELAQDRERIVELVKQVLSFPSATWERGGMGSCTWERGEKS
jgi:uracil-DNA glycosylase